MNSKKLLAVSGYSYSGKTTLLKKLIPLLTKRGLKVGVIKHAHHDIDIDIPGKDSYELRKAGALQTMVACDKRYAMICETPENKVDFQALISQFTHVDIVLVEGFKDEKLAKLTCHLASSERPPFIDEFTLAVASDETLDINLPQLDINDSNQIVEFIMSHIMN